MDASTCSVLLLQQTPSEVRGHQVAGHFPQACRSPGPPGLQGRWIPNLTRGVGEKPGSCCSTIYKGRIFSFFLSGPAPFSTVMHKHCFWAKLIHNSHFPRRVTRKPSESQLLLSCIPASVFSFVVVCPKIPQEARSFFLGCNFIRIKGNTVPLHSWE